MPPEPTITFVTGGQPKADYLARYLEFPIRHTKLDLDEIQSLDIKKIVERKARQAYEEVRGPVIVEDVSLEFKALGGLPGPFIRFFVERVPFDTLCAMVDGKDRSATARCVMGYCEGGEVVLFESSMDGEIAKAPSGEKGFGWDRIFIPAGYDVTRAELGEEDDRKTYLQIKPFAQLKAFLERIRVSE